MAETLTPTKMGTANASPKPEQPEPPKWMSEEDAEKYEKFLHRQHIRKNDKENSDLYFYVPETIVAYQPGGVVAGEEDQMYKFLVQKYHRAKTVKKTVRINERTSEEIDAPQPVDQHVMTKRGHWKCIDPDANFLIPVTEFKEKFAVDNLD